MHMKQGNIIDMHIIYMNNHIHRALLQYVTGKKKRDKREKLY